MTTRRGATPRGQAPLGLDDQLSFALYSAALAMTRFHRELLDGLHLTYPQYLVMVVLWERDQLRVSDLGTRLFLDSATLTPLLKRLEAAGLISRTRSRDDERSVIVVLTDAGRALRERARPIPGQVNRASCLTAQQSEVLRTSLIELRERVLELE